VLVRKRLFRSRKTSPDNETSLQSLGALFLKSLILFSLDGAKGGDGSRHREARCQLPVSMMGQSLGILSCDADASFHSH
jgi:hypothetical protein